MRVWYDASHSRRYSKIASLIRLSSRPYMLQVFTLPRAELNAGQNESLPAKLMSFFGELDGARGVHVLIRYLSSFREYFLEGRWLKSFICFSCCRNFRRNFYSRCNFDFHCALCSLLICCETDSHSEVIGAS